MKTKETNPTRPGSPTPCKQALNHTVQKDSREVLGTSFRFGPTLEILENIQYGGSSVVKTDSQRSRFIWSAICFKIMTRYTCGFFPRILAIIPATRYTCVFCHVYLGFIPKYTTIFLQTRIYMRTKKPIYMRHKLVTNKHVVYAVAESRRIRGTELYRQQKTPSCTMELKSNFSLNQAWPQCPR